MHFKLKQANPGIIDPDDIIYMRASEMYLIEAEAKLMMDDLEGTKEALRPLAEARNSAWDADEFNTEEEFFEHVKFQWRLEMWEKDLDITTILDGMKVLTMQRMVAQELLKFFIRMLSK